MKINASISKILSNKYLLNIIYVLCFFNVIGYLIYRKFDIVIIFFLLVFLFSKFSKYLTIVFGCPLIIINLFNMNYKLYEGLENNDSKKDDSEKNENVNNHVNTDSKKSEDPIKNSSTNTYMESSNTKMDESFEVGRNKKKGSYEIDYASTVEEAYDELNKIIGGDGMKKLTGDTQGLIKQQMELTKAMEGMAPLINGMGPLLNQAKGLLGSMDTSNIADMAKKFTAGK